MMKHNSTEPIQFNSSRLTHTVQCNLKYWYIQFFAFDYDSLPISFQSGITFPLVALDKIYFHPFSQSDRALEKGKKTGERNNKTKQACVTVQHTIR